MLEVGQKAVALRTRINNIGVGIIEDNIYPVLEIKQCICGLIGVDVGLRVDTNKYPVKWCVECGHREANHSGIAYAYAKDLAPLSDLTEMEQALNEAKEILEGISDFKPFP